MKTKLISSVKEMQQEVMLRLELLHTEKIQSLQEKPVSFHDVIELDIIETVTAHLHATFEISSEDVPVDILLPWAIVKVHKDLLALYNKKTNRVTDNDYLEILDKVANKLFISLFAIH